MTTPPPEPGDGPPRRLPPDALDAATLAGYALVIDARSPREYAEDHVPGAVNLPVVNDDEYAAVGTLHRTDPHAAYLVGVQWSLRNIAGHLQRLIAQHPPQARFLVYCFRGGKRSRLWADNLRTIGYAVDVLDGGWKQYRRWVIAQLEQQPGRLRWQVLCGPTGCGKTRLLHALRAQGAQVLDLEELAQHRGSLLGAWPGRAQPTQKSFDSSLLAQLRRFDPARPVWVEAESGKIGRLQLPDALLRAMQRGQPWWIDAPMTERVRLWQQDYAHFDADPVAMVRLLAPLKPLIGGQVLAHWQALAQAGDSAGLFEQVMRQHYDPGYARSTQRQYGEADPRQRLLLPSLSGPALAAAAAALCADPRAA